MQVMETGPVTHCWYCGCLTTYPRVTMGTVTVLGISAKACIGGTSTCPDPKETLASNRYLMVDKNLLIQAS